MRTIIINNPGPQGPVGPTGPQGPSVPFTNIGNDVYATTSSLQVTGSFLVSGSSTFTNIGPAIFSGSTAVSGSLTVNEYNVVTVNQTSSMSVATASYLNTLNQDLTFNGNLTLNGTASISTLVVNQTQYSSGSNQLGDNTDDTQTLYGTVVIPTGSLTVTGSTIISSSANTQLQVGSNLLFVSSSGNVGIGTATPATTLQIAGTATLRAISPELDNTYNIGSATFRYNNIYARAILSGASTLDLYSTISSFFDSVGNRRMTIVGSSGNVIIGSSATDAGFRLDVNGTARLSDTLSFTNNSSLSPQGTTAADRRLLIRGGEGGAVGSTSLITLTTNGNITSTSGNPVLVNISRDFTPTSGTATYTLASITGVINQTGGANGITRGLYINPTLTSAADYRAIETTSGSVIFNHGATPLMFISSSGNVGIGTATPTNTIDIVSTTTGSLRISGSAGSQITLVRPTAGLFGYVRYLGSNAMDIGTNGADPLRLNTNNTTRISIADTGFVGIGIGTSVASALLQVRGSGTTSVTTALLVQNSTPTNLLSVLDNGQVSFTSPTMSLAASQSAFSISPIISASNIVGGQYYGINITPTFFQTTGSQTETAFRVAATFTQSSAAATSGSNIIADFGSTSAGSQLTVTDVTSGSIYMVNDVSGIPIIEATSNWDVNIYDFPNKVFEKTGSQVNIYGTMRVSGSFILPLSQSVAPQTGSAYWSGSFLFIYDGTRYRSSSFA